jgi:hypothetical protein
LRIEKAIALRLAYYHFCRVHKSLRVTPAMEAGIMGSPMDIRDIALLAGN